jgi:hypothetical protein
MSISASLASAFANMFLYRFMGCGSGERGELHPTEFFMRLEQAVNNLYILPSTNGFPCNEFTV